jgi:hypothetical protein
MGLIINDVDIIRAVRCLCLQHKFQEAISLARKVEDEPSRNTLVLICKSFECSQIKVRAA